MNMNDAWKLTIEPVCTHCWNVVDMILLFKMFNHDEDHDVDVICTDLDVSVDMHEYFYSTSILSLL